MPAHWTVFLRALSARDEIIEFAEPGFQEGAQGKSDDQHDKHGYNGKEQGIVFVSKMVFQSYFKQRTLYNGKQEHVDSKKEKRIILEFLQVTEYPAFLVGVHQVKDADQEKDYNDYFPENRQYTRVVLVRRCRSDICQEQDQQEGGHPVQLNLGNVPLIVSKVTAQQVKGQKSRREIQIDQVK
jgi:hypothetical protein